MLDFTREWLSIPGWDKDSSDVPRHKLAEWEQDERWVDEECTTNPKRSATSVPPITSTGITAPEEEKREEKLMYLSIIDTNVFIQEFIINFKYFVYNIV